MKTSAKSRYYLTTVQNTCDQMGMIKSFKSNPIVVPPSFFLVERSKGGVFSIPLNKLLA